MRSFVAVSFLVLFTFGCDAAEPSSDAPAPTPAATAPKPTHLEVCTHVMDLMKQDPVGGSIELAEADMANIREQCAAGLDKEQAKLSAEMFDAQIACVMATTKLEDIEKCEQSEDLLGAEDPTATTDPTSKPTARQICKHIMDVMKREIGDAEAMPSDEEMTELQDKCVEDLGKQRDKLGAKAFDGQGACVMKAETVTDMTKCDEKK